MRYPVDVYTGKIQAYPEGKPSAIAKIQVDGELMLTELGLEGDEQAEKKVHGGPDRALCHYPREHYLYWAREFPEQAELFVAPAFGENLSTDGLTESNVYMGDIFRCRVIEKLDADDAKAPTERQDRRFFPPVVGKITPGV